MAQVFDRGLTLALKTGLAIALAVLVLGVCAWHWGTDYPNAVNAPVRQAIPFSHQHHVRDDGIDCRFCHGAVEQTGFAGMPSTQVCMTCHSQLFRDAAMLSLVRESWASRQRLQWIRVHDLPDFVYFDHSAHVTHGVPCVQCHGRVDRMPLMERVSSLQMQWCLECHRDPAPHLVPAEQVFSMEARAPATPDAQAALLAGYRVLDSRWLTDCSTCHR